jgi:nucleoid DNA-binding protein
MAENEKKASPKSITKSELYTELSTATGMSKGDVRKFFDALSGVIVNHLGKKGTGVLTLPGLMKLKAVKKPAQKGGQRRPNPFKPGEFIITKPKPAETKVRVMAVKALRESLK